MNNYLKNNISFILKIFLYLQPVIDIITGVMINYFHINFTLGMIVRFLSLLFIIYFYLFLKKSTSKYKKYYLLGILIFILIFGIVNIIYKDINVLSFEISNILKIFYFPILLTIIDYKDINIKLDDIINIGIIYLALIAIPNTLNISYNSYTQGKIGSVGLFNSGNEISAIISLLTPFLIYYIFSGTSIYKKVLIVLLSVYTYFSIGSKIVIIVLVFSILFNIYLYLKNNKIDKKKTLIGISVVLICFLALFFVLPKTNFYYNIKLHLNFLGINSINDIFSYNFINRFIFSDRLTFLSNTNASFISSSFVQQLFGIGLIENYATDMVSIKTIEMDFFDIFYSSGIVGFILFIIPIIKYIKNDFKKSSLLLKYTIILVFMISLLAGHVLLAPSVSILLIFVLKCNGGML